MQAQIKIPIPTQRRVLKVGKEMLNCSSPQGNLWQLNAKDVQEIPKFQKIQKIQKIQKSNLAASYHFRISPDCVPHMEEVFSIVRRICDREPTDDLQDFDGNTAIWSTCMSVKLQAAVHHGRDYFLNLRPVKNQSSKSVEHFVDQRTEGDHRIVHDELGPAFEERIISFV